MFTLCNIIIFLFLTRYKKLQIYSNVIIGYLFCNKSDYSSLFIYSDGVMPKSSLNAEEKFFGVLNPTA